MPVELRNAQHRFRVDTRKFRAIAESLLAALDRPEATLSILLTDDRGIAKLHERWMGEKGPTDVLSFPMDDRILGDVVISVETAARRAKRVPRRVPGLNTKKVPGLRPGTLFRPGTLLEREMTEYLIHGLLHLIGYDHARKRDRLRMDAQARLLAKVVQDA